MDTVQEAKSLGSIIGITLILVVIGWSLFFLLMPIIFEAHESGLINRTEYNTILNTVPFIIAVAGLVFAYTRVHKLPDENKDEV